jgi:hypothetical protein
MPGIRSESGWIAVNALRARAVLRVSEAIAAGCRPIDTAVLAGNGRVGQRCQYLPRPGRRPQPVQRQGQGGLAKAVQIGVPGQQSQGCVQVAITGRGHGIEDIGLQRRRHRVEVALQPVGPSFNYLGIHFITRFRRNGQSKNNPGRLVSVGAIIIPPAPAAVVELEPVEPLQTGVNLGWQIGPQRRIAYVQLVEGAAHNRVGQGTAHGLLQTTIRETGQVIQPFQERAGNGAAQFDTHTAQRQRVSRQVDSRGQFSPKLPYLAGHVRYGQRPYRQRQLHRIQRFCSGKDAGKQMGLTGNHGRQTPTHNANLPGGQTNGLGRLAAKAGVIPPTEHALIGEVRGYGRTEGKRVDEVRSKARVGNKKKDAIVLTAVQARQIKTQHPPTPQGSRDRLLIGLLLDWGLRASEAAALTVDDLAEPGYLTVYRQKTDTTDRMELTADLLAALADYQPYMRGSGILLRGSRKNGELTNQVMSTRAIGGRVKILGRDILGLWDLSPHDLHHTWATRAAKESNPFVLRDAGGWTNMQPAGRYVERA